MAPWSFNDPSTADDANMPAEWRLLADEHADAQCQCQVAQAVLVLGLRRAGRPLLLVDDVAKVVQFAGREQIVELNDLSVRALEPSDTPIGGERRERVEASLGHAQANSLKIPARGAASALAGIEDELIDG